MDWLLAIGGESRCGGVHRFVDAESAGFRNSSGDAAVLRCNEIKRLFAAFGHFAVDKGSKNGKRCAGHGRTQRGLRRR
jgi:hypothetical protein